MLELRIPFSRSIAICLLILAQIIAMIALSPSASAAQPSNFSDLQVSAMQGVVSNNRDVFGGLVVDEATGLVTIYLASSAEQSRRQQALSALTTSAVSATNSHFTAARKWSVRYVTGGPSLATLDSVLAQVKNQAWSANITSHLISFGINPALRAVNVAVDSVSTTLAQDTEAAFGTLVVLRTMERPQFVSRLLDGQPWWGGDRIYDSGWWGWIQCTGGFPATNNSNGHRGMLTAGHCFSNGENVKQGYRDSNGNFHYAGNMGNVTIRSYCSYCLDGEFIDSQAVGSSVQYDVYTSGGQWGQNSATIYGWGQSSNGMGVCLDGSFTTENCSGTVIGTEECVNVSGQMTCNLTEVSSPSRACQPGDSGGPAYVYWGSQAIGAYGLVDACNSAGTDSFYTELRDAMNVLGVSLIAY